MKKVVCKVDAGRSLNERGVHAIDADAMSADDQELFRESRAVIERELGRKMNVIELLKLCIEVTRKKPTKD
jgi:hypothetical protein